MITLYSLSFLFIIFLCCENFAASSDDPSPGFPSSKIKPKSATLLPPSLCVISQRKGRPALTQSPQDPLLLSDGPKSRVTSANPYPPIVFTPWNLEQTQVFIEDLADNKKIWASFFEVLCRLSPPFTSSLLPEGPIFDHYPPVFMEGATLRGGQHTPYHVTNTGLIQKAINEGTLLIALKKTGNKIFDPVIKRLESPPPSIKYKYYEINIDD